MADKVTIGLTPENNRVVEELIERGFFLQDLDAAKFALSLALSHRVAVVDVPGASTKWNVGSFDRDGQLKALIDLLDPTSGEPYRAIESLVNSGFGIIGKRLDSGIGNDVGALLDLAAANQVAGGHLAK